MFCISLSLIQIFGLSNRDFHRSHGASPVGPCRRQTYLLHCASAARKTPLAPSSVERRGANATVVGIDLTGSDVRPSGWCVLQGPRAETGMIGSDEEIIALV